MTVRDQATLLAEFADNTSGAITAQFARDIIDTLFAHSPTLPSWDIPVRRLTSGASTTLVHVTDYLLNVDKGTGSATTVTLPGTPAAGWRFEVKDGKGDAAVNNITVVPTAGTIDDVANYLIKTPYGSATFTYDGTQWVVT
jgi:hypothetical protein